MDYKERALELIQDGYDLHIHTNPSHFNRLQDDFELLQALDRLHMAGAVIKVHYGATQARADIANRYADAKAKLYGAVTLDWPVGGLNPYAVRSELLLGAKMVWLPTFHAKNHMEKTLSAATQPVPAPPISVTDDNGRLLPAIYDIIDTIREFDGVLNTGHISAEESLLVCKEAAAHGIKVCLTHPDNSREAVPMDIQAELAGLGVFIDRSWLNTIKQGGVPCEEMAARITAVGAEHCIMTTDFGQPKNGDASMGMLSFIEAMLKNGICEDDIRTMIYRNPCYLLSVK